MKKTMSWIITGLVLAWLAGGLRASETPDFHFREFGRLPVLLNGRIQPLDTIARNSLLQLRAKQTVPLPGGGKMTAIQWLTELLLLPAKADERKVFRLDHPELAVLLKLPDDEKHFSFNQIRPGLEELDKQAERINHVESQMRTPFEKQVLRLHSALTLYHRLKNSLQAEDTTNLVQEIQQFQKAIPDGVAAYRARENNQPFDQETFNQFIKQLSRYDMMANVAYPLLIPLDQAGGGRTEFKSMGQVLLDLPRGGTLPPAVNYYATMAVAYRQNQPLDFNQALVAYGQWLQSSFGKDLKKVNLESFYNSFQPFYKALVIYLLAMCLGFVFWFKGSETMRRSGYFLLVLALVVHSLGIALRMMIEGRPPVTNLYSSAVFIGWGAVLLGIVLERIFRDGIGIVVAGTIGFGTQIVAHHLSMGGDTMEPLRAVLDTNFWLATHVVTITLGYSANFVAGFLAIVYILRGVLTRSLTADMAQSLERMV
jgi:hypothetical protein